MGSVEPCGDRVKEIRGGFFVIGSVRQQLHCQAAAISGPDQWIFTYVGGALSALLLS